MSFNRFLVAELKRLSIYLNKFLNVTSPTLRPDVKKMRKQDWIDVVTEMTQGGNFPVDRVADIMDNIRWLKDHRFTFRQNINVQSNTFAMKFIQTFRFQLHEHSLTLQDDNYSVMVFDLVNFHIPAGLMTMLTNATVSDRRRILNEMPPVYVEQVQTELKIDVTDEVAEQNSELECKICLTNKVCIVLTSCGHLFCSTCTKNLSNKCAKCRKPFKDSEKIRVFF